VRLSSISAIKIQRAKSGTSVGRRWHRGFLVSIVSQSCHEGLAESLNKNIVAARRASFSMAFAARQRDEVATPGKPHVCRCGERLSHEHNLNSPDLPSRPH